MSRKSSQPAPATSQPAAGGVASVDRALSLLDAFSVEAPVLTLSELALRTSQYKSTVSRLLASLENAHLVRRRADGRYALGSAVPRLHAVYAASFTLGDAVTPALRELVERTGESAAFHVRQGNDDFCLTRVDSPHPVRDHARAGELRPLNKTVGGAVLRAYGGGTGARSERIRREHVFVSDGDVVAELAAVAAPVFGTGAAIVGAIVLTMPSTRWRAAHVGVVREAARKLTRTLGGTGPATPG